MKRLVISGLITFCTFFFLNPSLSQAKVYLDQTYDVVIDVGHGGIDGGTSFNEFLEKDINLAVGVKLYEALKSKPYHVGITRIRDYALSDDSQNRRVRGRHTIDLNQRKLIADALEPRVFISLHVNWSKNNQRRGPLVIYQASEESYALAHIMQAHLNEFYGVKKKAIRGNSYFLMKHLDMPSVIVELGYISNEKDRSIITESNTQDQLVQAIVYAIDEYFLLYPTNERSQYETE